MKAQFPKYGRTGQDIAHTLTAKDNEILEAFLRFCAMSANDETVNRHRRNLLYFRDVVEKELDSITREDAIEFWGLVKRAPYERHTQVSLQKSVKRFLKWQFRDYETLEALKIKKHRVNKRRLNKAALLKPEERLRMHRCAESIRDRALFVTLYETAGRPQEIKDLKWKDVDWDGNEVNLYSSKTENGRSLPVRDAVKHLKRLHNEGELVDPKGDDFIFPSRRGGGINREKSISVEYINRLIKSLAKRAGVDKNVNTYLLRHTRLTELRKKGVQGKLFRLFAGHVDGSTEEEVYVHLDNDDMKAEVIEKVFEIDEIEPSEREAFVKRVERLERQLKEVVAYLRDSRSVMTAVSSQLVTNV